MGDAGSTVRRQRLRSGSKAVLWNPVIPPRLWIESVGGMAVLAGRTAVELATPGLSWRTEFVRQYIFALTRTLVPATIVAFVVGLSSIGIQGGSLASAFGAVDRISAVGPVAFLRELGPVLTTAIVAGTLGATITAELGARVIRQEIEALEVLGISPIRNLVLPRVAALALMMPVLMLLTFWAGIAGIFVATVGLYGNTPAAFFSNLFLLTSFIDLWSSVVKVIAFGVVIGIISSYKGLSVGGGTAGVGRAVNEAVVASLVAIFAISVVYTSLFLALYPEVNYGG